MKEKEIIDKLKELQNDSFEWQGGEDLIDFIKNLKKENEELHKEIERQGNAREIEEEYFEKNFISKDKVRQKINKFYSMAEANFYMDIDTTMKFFEELLEEE